MGWEFLGEVHVSIAEPQIQGRCSRQGLSLCLFSCLRFFEIAAYGSGAVLDELAVLQRESGCEMATLCFPRIAGSLQNIE